MTDSFCNSKFCRSDSLTSCNPGLLGLCFHPFQKCRCFVGTLKIQVNLISVSIDFHTASTNESHGKLTHISIPENDKKNHTLPWRQSKWIRVTSNGGTWDPFFIMSNILNLHSRELRW